MKGEIDIECKYCNMILRAEFEDGILKCHRCGTPFTGRKIEIFDWDSIKIS